MNLFNDNNNSLNKNLIKEKTTTADLNNSDELKKELEKYIELYNKQLDLNKELNFELKTRRLEVHQLKNDLRKIKRQLREVTKKADKFKRVKKITPCDITWIKNLRAEGLSYTKIENLTSWSKYTISKVLNGAYDKSFKDRK